MAATLTTAPPSLALNGNDIWIELESDLVDTAQSGYIDIVSQEPGEPIIGEELTIEWGGNAQVFTVAATSNDTATAIPVRNVGETMDEYAERMAEVFKQNSAISSDFHVTVHSVGRVRLRARVAGVLDITVTENLTSTEFTTVDGIDPNTQPNLAVQVQIWKPSGFLSLPDELITTLHATYNTTTATTEINLSELFQVKPHLPNDAHIDPAIFSTWLKGVATDCFTEYYLRYADKYGTPAVPEALIKSDSYYVINGAHSADRSGGLGFSFNVDKLHNYRNVYGVTFWKPIGDGQPDWLYIWVKSPLTDCNVEWDILWDDGTTTNEPYGGTPFDLDIYTAYYIRSTPLNFNFTPPTPGAIPWYITFRLKGNADGPATFAEVKYKAMVETSWERHLLFDNGLGGCESVLFYGKGKESFTANRSSARRNRTSDFDISEGELILLNTEGQKEFELNTGWIEPWYADHLRQLLLGDVWLVDFDNERFIKLICDTDSVVTTESDQQLFALSIKFTTAWLDKASNV